MRFIGIDPASKTGLVALSPAGNVLKAKELTGIGDKDPKRMTTLIYDIVQHIDQNDVVCIEGFPFATQKAMFAGGLGHGIRNELFKKGIKYYEVAPNAVKKFVNVTGWTGEPGNKKRLTGLAKKRAVMDAVRMYYGFVHSSDNVVDAYILAQIARSLTTKKVNASYQNEVCQAILNPKKKVKK